MCGRFHNHVKAMHGWVDVLQDWPAEAALSYNMAPTQQVPIVTNAGTVTARWGLVPQWEKAFSTKYPTHNARLETVREKPSFRAAWKHSRTCLVPTGGFYEWRQEGEIKQPYFIHKPDDLLVFAGLWEFWNDKISFTILTTEARGIIATLHHRMPVMLDISTAEQWLETSTDMEQLLQGSPLKDTVEAFGVSRQVNRASNEGPDLILRLPA